jgi:hypothetical protein
MGEMKNAYKMLFGKPEGKRPLKGLGVNGRIILKQNLWKQGLGVWILFIWLRIGTCGRLL